MSQEQDRGAVPRASTINASVPCIDPLNQEARKSRDRTARLRECMCNCRCIYDGGEIGSTGLLRMKEITGKERPSVYGETHATVQNYNCKR